MSSKVIATVLHAAYALTSGSLMITASGGIVPGGIGITALHGPASRRFARVSNAGTLLGGHGGRGPSGAGGVGVDLAGASAQLSNSGSIGGGAGGAGRYGHGGVGVYLGGQGTLINSGWIGGGAGGTAPAGGVAGGAGVYLAAGCTAQNTGTISGGAGGNGRTGGGGGEGIYSLGGGTILGGGAITGGAGGAGTTGGGGGIGILLEAPGGLAIGAGGAITGGAGGSGSLYGGAGGAGILLAQGGQASNAGTIAGGMGGAATYPQAGAGGAGAVIYGGTFTETGTILGGAGGGSAQGAGGMGGDAVDLDGGTLIVSGTLAAGAAGTGALGSGYAGDAVRFGAAPATLTLDPGAVIEGQVDANPSVLDTLELAGTQAATLAVLGTQFTGFADVVIASGADWQISGPSTIGGSFVVAGSLTVATALANPVVLDGGHLANGGALYAGVLGSGTLVNEGTIGTAGAYGVSLGAGALVNGAGAVVTGAVSGVIAAGPNAVTVTTAGRIGSSAGSIALSFGSGADRLILDQGCSFAGRAVGGGAASTLELAQSNGAATLSGLGAAIAGFETVVVDANQKWTATGANALDAASTLTAAGNLAGLGTLADAGALVVPLGGEVELEGQGAMQFAHVSMAGGAIDGNSLGVLAIGAAMTGARAGAVTIESQAVVSGYGTLGGAPIVDDGTIDAAGGPLVLATPISGTGTVLLQAGGTLVSSGALDVSVAAFAAGAAATLVLDTPKSANQAIISGFAAGDLIDLKNLDVATLSFQAGTLSLGRGHSIFTTLTLTGTYSAASFTLTPDGAGGTDIGISVAGFHRPPHTAGMPEPIGALDHGWGGGADHAFAMVGLHPGPHASPL